MSDDIFDAAVACKKLALGDIFPDEERAEGAIHRVVWTGWPSFLQPEINMIMVKACTKRKIRQVSYTPWEKSASRTFKSQ